MANISEIGKRVRSLDLMVRQSWKQLRLDGTQVRHYFKAEMALEQKSGRIDGLHRGCQIIFPNLYQTSVHKRASVAHICVSLTWV